MVKTGRRFGSQLRRRILSGFSLLLLVIASAIPLGSLQADYSEAERWQENGATQTLRYSTMLSMALIGNLNDDTLGSIARVNASFLDLIFYADRSVENGPAALSNVGSAGLGGSVSVKHLFTGQVLPPPAIAWESWAAGDRQPIALFGTNHTHNPSVAPPQQDQPLVTLLLARYTLRTSRSQAADILLNRKP